MLHVVSVIKLDLPIYSKALSFQSFPPTNVNKIAVGLVRDMENRDPLMKKTRT